MPPTMDMTTSGPEISHTHGIHLDEWDKLMIVFSVAFFLMFVLVLAVCVLSPLCCLHRYCCCQYPDEIARKSINSYGPEAYGSMDEFNGTYNHKRKHTKAKQGHKWYPMATLRESEVSDWSDISQPELIEMNPTPSTKRRDRRVSRSSDYSSSTNSVLNPTHPDSRLSYGVTMDTESKKVYIRVIQLGNFRVTEPNGAQAPYVKVRLYKLPKGFFGVKKSRDSLHHNFECELQTKIQRRTDNPVYNEKFELPCNDLDSCVYVLRLLVCDLDKYARHVVVGEVTCDLTKTDNQPGEEVLHNDLICTPQEENLGDIHLALMYLPTAEKLSITVLNCRGLRLTEVNKKTIETFVKITMVYDGRQLKKHKTASKVNEANPVFGDTFVFDVPAFQLDNVHFSVSVIGLDKDKEDGSMLLGRLYVGVNFDREVKAQWMEMVQHARKQVACWHRLHI